MQAGYELSFTSGNCPLLHLMDETADEVAGARWALLSLCERGDQGCFCGGGDAGPSHHGKKPDGVLYEGR